MLQTIALYIRQRFSLFPFLAAFLMLYVNGLRWGIGEAVGCFLYTMVLLFWFRLFDDIASREADAGKPDRIYLQEGPFQQLRRLLIPLAIALMAATFLYHAYAGILLGIWFVLQTLGYRFLCDRDGWRHILPLLKYPVIALLLWFPSGSSAAGSIGEMLVCVSLLPTFVLFESLDDPSYHLRRPVAVVLLVLLHLLLLPTIGPQCYLSVSVGMGLVLLLGYLHGRITIAGGPYLFLLYVLLLRVLSIEYGV